MRTILLIALFGLSGITHAQKLYTSTGFTTFYVDETLLVPIKADNKTTTAVIDLDAMQVAALMQIQDFDFPNDLMEEHFNENYMLTHEHPKAFFEGSISGLDVNSTDQQVVEISGIMTIKGFSKPFECQAIVTYTEDKIEVNGSFEIHPKDYEIDLPKIMFTPVFESVIAKFEYTLEPKDK